MLNTNGYFDAFWLKFDVFVIKLSYGIAMRYFVFIIIFDGIMYSYFINQAYHVFEYDISLHF